MSVENLKKYAKLCAEDEKARNKAKEIGLQDLEGHIAYGKSLGLEFSKEDFEALVKEAGVMSEEDLEKVAGGVDISVNGIVTAAFEVIKIAVVGPADIKW